MPGRKQACDRLCKVSAVGPAVLPHHVAAHPDPPPSSSDLFLSPLPTQRRGHTCPSTPTAVSLNQLSESCFGLQLAGGVKGRGSPALSPAWNRTPGLGSLFLSFMSFLLSVPRHPISSQLRYIIHHLSCKYPQVPGSSCELHVLLPGRNFSSGRIHLSIVALLGV